MHTFLARFLLVIPFVLAPLEVAYAQAGWPNGKAIRIVVAAPPGGSTEMIARQIAEGMSTRLGVPVNVENRPGSGGTLGTAQVVKEPADGHTLLLGTVSTHGVAPSVLAKLPYDPIKDFTALTTVATIPNVVVVNTASPAKTLGAFVAMAKANPGKYTYASNGAGTSNGLATALLASISGVTMTDIPYKGSTPARSDLLTGNVDLMLDVVMTAEPHIRSGKLRPLAVTSLNRSALLPDVPTVAEQGYPGFEAIVWFGMFAPPKLPSEIAARLHQELAAVIRGGKLTKYLESQGAVPVVMSPAEFSKFIRNDIDKWAKVAKAAGIKPE
jgi:tripartite-type tricarboxylate transporter receptor subunit TctC